jgi:N-acetyl-anhydromuramyl-L-alanine amidase AmpD
VTEVSLQSRVRILDNASHHGGERGDAPTIISWHATRDRGNALSVIQYLNSTTDKKASYNYLIDRDGWMTRHCRPEFVAYSCGDSAYPYPIPGDGTEDCRPNGGNTINKRQLSIAWCIQDEEGEAPTLEQRASGLWLAKVYMRRYDIPPSMNVGHKEVSPGRKTDPITVDMKDWRRQIGEYFAR